MKRLRALLPDHIVGDGSRVIKSAIANGVPDEAVSLFILTVIAMFLDKKIEDFEHGR